MPVVQEGAIRAACSHDKAHAGARDHALRLVGTRTMMIGDERSLPIAVGGGQVFVGRGNCYGASETETRPR